MDNSNNFEYENYNDFINSDKNNNKIIIIKLLF